MVNVLSAASAGENHDRAATAVNKANEILRISASLFSSKTGIGR
jgi:hypothetical protein